MPLPNQPIALQVNWTDAQGVAAWEQTNANILSDCVQEVVITRSLCLAGIEEDTCRLVCTDPDWDLVMGRVASVLYPNVVPGRRVRILEQDASAPGTWYAKFFGYITEIEPTPTDERPATVTLLLESPLHRLADQVVTLPELAAGLGVAQAIAALLTAAPIHPTFYQLDAFYRNTALPAAWGGGEATFGQALAELLLLAQAVAAVEPQYAVAASDPDYILRIWQATTTPTQTWSYAPASGDIEMGSTVVYAGQVP